MSEGIYITRRTQDTAPDRISVEMSEAQYEIVKRDARLFDGENQTLCQTAETRPYEAYDRFRRIMGQLATAEGAVSLRKSFAIESPGLDPMTLEDEQINPAEANEGTIELYLAAMNNLLTDPKEKALELEVLIRTEGANTDVFGPTFPILSLDLEHTSDQAA